LDKSYSNDLSNEGKQEQELTGIEEQESPQQHKFLLVELERGEFGGEAKHLLTDGGEARDSRALLVHVQVGRKHKQAVMRLRAPQDAHHQDLHPRRFQ
jgi:hypothetical protein